MAEQAFESTFVVSNLAPPFLDGTISAPIVKEAGDTTSPPKAASNMVIRTDRAWEIEVNWEVHGSLLDNPTSSSFPFTGEWLVKAFLESIGPGGEYELPRSGGVASGGVKVNVNTATGKSRNYKATIEVPAKLDTSGNVNKDSIPAGIYKLVVTVTNESSPGVPGPIAGFYESGMLQIYEPE
jgi:hypothetical protein